MREMDMIYLIFPKQKKKIMKILRLDKQGRIKREIY